MQVSAYSKLFQERYKPEIEDLAKVVHSTPEATEFASMMRVLCILFKAGDYEFDRYIGLVMREYFKGRIFFCDEIMEKVGYMNTCVEAPFVSIYPEKFFVQGTFDIESYADILTCLSEALNNLIRKQKYPDHDVKKRLLNHRPLRLELLKSVNPLVDREADIIVARTYFQVLASSCFHSAKNGAYPLVQDHWKPSTFYINGRTIPHKVLAQKFAEFTWKTVLDTLEGDSSKNVKPVYPANEIFITGDYEFIE